MLCEVMAGEESGVEAIRSADTAMEGIVNASALEEQGGKTSDKELVTEARKVDPRTVVGQLPVPFELTVQEPIQHIQREGMVVGPPDVSGPEPTTPIFTGRSPTHDHVFEIQSERSLPVSRSSSFLSEESLDLTLEREKDLKASRSYSRELEKALISQLDLANSDQSTTQVSRPIEAEQNMDTRVDYQPRIPIRCESDTLLFVPKQTPEQRIAALESENKIFKDLLCQAFDQLQSAYETQQEQESRFHLQEREHAIYQKDYQERELRIEKLMKSNAWLSQKLEKEALITMLVQEDQFDKIYRFVEAKSNFLVEGNRCIVCDNVSDSCVHMQPEGQQCNRPNKEHRQTRLNHKFKAQNKGGKCNHRDQDGQLCGCLLVQHQDLGQCAGLCQSHLYPEGVLLKVCEGNNRRIYDGVDHTSRTPSNCKRQLICALCEPVTSELEDGLIDRMKSDLHRQYPSDEILFSILVYRSMVFNLCHFQEQCCNQYRADIKAIIQYGWNCHFQLRYPNPAYGTPTPPILLYLQSPSDKLPDTLHLPAVCELDLTALQPPPPSELGKAVVAIYGCIPPYHYILLRDPSVPAKLQRYSRQITLSINRRLSEELKAYYQKNEQAKLWLEGQQKCPELGQHWWPILTFGHLKCCLKIQIE